jgi:hypothetical protein
MSLEQVDNLQHVNHISASPCVNTSTRTDPNYSVIILSDSFRLSRHAASVGGRLSAMDRTMRKHELTNDVCHIKCGPFSRSSQSDALTSRDRGSSMFVFTGHWMFTVNAGLYNTALVSFGVSTCLPSGCQIHHVGDSYSVSGCQVRGVCESQQQNKENAPYTRSNTSTVRHQQPRPLYILAAGKTNTAPVLN